jgi:TRAP transporter TAXI family solute receptor
MEVRPQALCDTLNVEKRLPMTRRNPRMMQFGAFAVATMMLAACGANGDDAAADGTSRSDGNEVFPSFISIGTGGTGGTAYPIGGVFSSVLSESIDGVTFTAETTGGSIDNVRLVANGEVQMGQIAADVAYEACNGEGRFEGEPLDVSTYVVLYPNVLFPIWLESSDIESVADFPGHTVGVGDAGSGSDLFAQNAFNVLGLEDDSMEIVHLPFSDQTAAFRDNQLDAAFWASPRVGGTASLIDLAATADVDWSGFTPEQQEQMAEEYPYYSAGVIDAGTFRGQDADLPVVAVWHNYLGSLDLPEELVYQIVSTILSNAEEAADGQPSASDIAAENIQYAPCPIHPGAARAYQEAGADVPDEMIAQQ